MSNLTCVHFICQMQQIVSADQTLIAGEASSQRAAFLLCKIGVQMLILCTAACLGQDSDVHGDNSGKSESRVALINLVPSRDVTFASRTRFNVGDSQGLHQPTKTRDTPLKYINDITTRQVKSIPPYSHHHTRPPLPTANAIHCSGLTR